MSEVIMPKMGDAMEEGTLLSWRKQDGETVKAGEVIAEIETDKSNVEVEAEEDGVLHVQAQPGAVVPVGGIIAMIGDVPVPSVKAAAPARKTAEPAAPSAHNGSGAAEAPVRAAPAARGDGQERLKASPLARRVAREQGIDIAQITGTGPLGRIIEADVLAFAQAGVKESPSQAAPATAARLTGDMPQTREAQAPTPAAAATELSAIRRVIARRMVESKTTIPHFYLTAEIDMAEAIALRDKLNAYDETLPKISFNDMIVKASALALRRVPAVNVAFRDNKILSGGGVHVGIAVALDDGLIVPVVRDTDQLPLRKVAQTSKDLIKRARDKKLQPAEYSGGTFTVSNLGGFDVEEFLAIIDPAQGAILAVASIVKKPVVLDDGESIAARPRMKVTFSGDHRVMDGATGARFLQELKRLLQNPLSLLES